ncbi:MAG: YIP1 family protein [Longimicrobiales bacterium]|nr:YIP1 family protein [Longimicrobiales bacterium]
MAQGDLVQRMLGAATLNIDTFEEVEADESATMQAATVVAMVAVASAIGSVGHGGVSILFAPVAQIIGWLIWAGVTYVIGDKLFGGTATWGELLRTLGFAQAPGLLLLFAIVPILGGLVRFAVGIWMLVAGVIAIRQALDFSTGKAVLTAVIGWLAMLIPAMILGGMFGFGG